MVTYPTGPCPPECYSGNLLMLPGEGINAIPFEAEEYLDLTSQPGKCSGMVIGFLIQLGKWGFERVQVSRDIEVTPVFTEYYQKTIAQKKHLEAEAKNLFASLAKAIEEFELLSHDIRKYKEFLDYFKAVEEAKKKGDPEEIKRAEHVIRAMFIDLVDVHTGDLLSLRGIAPRWPTIIADFFGLTDDDVDADKIRKKLNIPRAEAEILATKNLLYKEWKNRLFLPMIKQRYKQIKELAEMRRKSIEEYRDQLRVTISRYKSMKETRESEGGRWALEKTSFFRPDAQAMSLDTTVVWCWKPYAPYDKYKATREALDKVDALDAGFTPEEIKQIHEAFKKNGKKWDGKVFGLPVQPSYDKIVRMIIKEIESDPAYAKYGIKITPMDVLEVIEQLALNYVSPERHEEKWPETVTTVRPGERWVFSPYFMFLEFTVVRLVIKLPDGSMLENPMFDPIRMRFVTQNIIIGRMLELRAKRYALDREISQMVGEYGVTELGDIDEILKKEYPELYGGEKKEEPEKINMIKKISVDIKNAITNIRSSIGGFLHNLGINLMFVYPGPYDKLMFDRMTRFHATIAGPMFSKMTSYLKSALNVPGAKW